MIPIFRKIRKKMADDNKPMKYIRYAIGEIVLVVIGILIALQINNWNEERTQKKILNDILQSIANGVESDLRELNLLSAARANITVKIDSIYKKYGSTGQTSLNIEEASYVNFAFTNILNTVHLNTSKGAYESLKNSIYFGKIQGTNLALLLDTYYKSSGEIRSKEDRYNQTIENLNQEWLAYFRNNGVNLFMSPWTTGDFAIVAPRFLEIMKDPRTAAIWDNGSREVTAIKSYQDQILMSQKLIEMIRDSKTTFDQGTQVDLSGILFTFGDASIVSLLIKGEVPTGFEIRYAASGLFPNYLSKVNDYFVMEYPANKYAWASSYFAINALNGRVDEMDFSAYSRMIIEMRGEKGGEVFEIGMKDINDPPDGSESKIKIELTDDWKVYEFETNQFVTADMNRIMIPLAFVFEGPIGRKIHVKSVQFN
jgi:hypothetical protein